MSYYRGKIPSRIIRAAKISRYRDRRNRHGKRDDGIRSRNPLYWERFRARLADWVSRFGSRPVDLGVPLQAFRDVTLRDCMKAPDDPRRNPYPRGTPAHAAFNLGWEEGAAK